MASHRIHNIRFYNLESKSVTCLCHESKTKKLALARLALIYDYTFILQTHDFYANKFFMT